MRYLGIFFEIILILCVVLVISSILSLINTPFFLNTMKNLFTIQEFGKFIFINFINIYRYVFLFSLFITFSIYFSLVDLKLFKVRSYMLAILAVPFLICAGAYYIDNYVLPSMSNFMASVFVSPFSTFSYYKILFYPIKIYHFSFLIFIVIPGAVLLNNRNWHLKTLIFLIIYLGLTLFLVQYINRYVLNWLKFIKNIKGFPPVNEMILSVIYIPAGIYFLNLADSIRKIRSRIDVGKIKKIQHK